MPKPYPTGSQWRHGAPTMPEGFGHFNYANPNAPKGGTFAQAILGNFDTLNPFSLKGTAAQSLNLVYDRPMMRSWDEPFTLLPADCQIHRRPCQPFGHHLPSRPARQISGRLSYSCR